MSSKLLLIILFSAIIFSCGKEDEEDESIHNTYKQHMRNFVENISQYAKSYNSNFLIIPQNGQELVTTDGNEDGPAESNYLGAIDGVGREDLFYGYDYDNVPTPPAELSYMIKFLDICEQHSVEVFITDYCWEHDHMDDSYARNNAKGYISFAAPERELNVIPEYPASIYHVNSNDIFALADAKNFLYLINTSGFAGKAEFIVAINATNYDLVIMDLFFEDDIAFSESEISQLKIKNNGGQRLVISYLSIGEAEDYRYYWNSSWSSGSPSWLAEENPNWEGNYKVRYWYPEWHKIIYGNDDSYLKKVMDAGFDGVYLDIIDAFEYFE